ncbi:glycoside hydrolase superfamily [Aspergillus carlsbadensis]|nr:glycoside hydrolase superfamily [Aspergillus carlsbadensis]
MQGIHNTAPFAQQIYISTEGTPGRPYCTRAVEETPVNNVPSYRFGEFSYTLTETVRTASYVEPSTLPTYGPSYAAVKHLLPSLSSSSWGNWDPNAVPTATDTESPYGQAAFSELWDNLDPPGFTRGLYSTTVSASAVMATELVLPPPLYFGPRDCYSFPEDFVFGVAGAAAQVEGAVADEGRSPALPELLPRAGGNLENDYTANENYYLYKEDIERLAAMGVKYYSFSVAWTRILPFAVPGSPVNLHGLRHYNDLINFVIYKGMQPIVTLLHFDTPAQFFGVNYSAMTERPYFGRSNFGYQNETFEDAFVNYGKVVMSHFADRVPIWITINEPQPGCASGPAIDAVIKSHARLYHFYKDELQGKGRVSMKMGVSPGIPQAPSNSSHVAAARHYDELNIGTFLYPLVLGKDYPMAYKMTIQDYVPLTEGDLSYLNKTLDFVGLDAYSATIIYPAVDIATCAADNASTNTLYPNCVGLTQKTVNGWNIGYHADYAVYAAPTYLRTQLLYLWDTFKIPVMITEFGLAISNTSDSQLDDTRFDIQRSEYFLSYLTEVLKSIWEDGVNVMGALMWTWVDNWEWGTYAHAFGLQHVNWTTQQRTYRRSFFDVMDFVEKRRT